MDIRRDLAAVAANVRTAAVAAGLPTNSLAEAADVDSSAFEARLDSGDVSIADLFNVGGFCRTPVSSFFEGAA